MVHRVRPGRGPEVVIAVLVEQAGRGAEVAAPIAGDLMTLYLKGGRERSRRAGRADAVEPRASRPSRRASRVR